MSGAVASSGKTWEEASAPEAVKISRHYEDSWRRSGLARPDLGVYLSDLQEQASKSGVRLALFRTDMSLRWESGDKVGAKWYLDRFPDLNEDVLVALVYEEFCLREEAGENPQAIEFQARYPLVSKALGRVFEIHGLVGSAEISVSSLSASDGSLSGLTPFPEVGQTIAGFHLVEELGKGAFARVFLAHERQLADRPVALKVTRKGSREPQTLARLQHTHIVPVYSHRVDPATGLNLLCMPYFGRITLAQILSDRKAATAHHGKDLAEALDRLAPAECMDSARSEGRRALESRTFSCAIAWWGARLAEALDHAHERGVLHRDIKPSNVLVTADGMPMLLDFNLAREPLVEGNESQSPENLGGTIDYMAPEHLVALAECSPNQVDGRSDIYGLGVLLYEAVMGYRPFPQIRKRNSISEALLSAADERKQGPPRLRHTNPEIPTALESVIRKCLEPEPNSRYQSSVDLSADLQAVADERPLLFARQPLLSRLNTWAKHRRRRLVVAAAILASLMLIVISLGALTLQSRIDQRDRTKTVRATMEKAQEAYEKGDFQQARLLYGMADQLSEAPNWRGIITHEDRKEVGRFRTLFSEVVAEFDEGHSLPDLQLLAKAKESHSASRAKRCEQADQFHREAEQLRFRLIGLGVNLESASTKLQAALEPFYIIPPAKMADWTQREDVKDRLDDLRLARLKHEVNELLFLWVSDIDISLSRSKTPSELASEKALDYIDRALLFVDRPEPWKALRKRLEQRWNRVQSRSEIQKQPLAEESPRSLSSLEEFAPKDVRKESSALASFQWGVLYLHENKYADSIRWLQRAVQLEAKNYWYQFYLAFVLDMRGGHPGEALVHYDVASDLSQGSPWIHFCRGRLYIRASNWAKGIEDLSLALQEFGVGAEGRPTQLELGLAYQSIGDDLTAENYFRSVINKDPTDSIGRAARLDLANGQADLGHHKVAIAEYGDLLSINPMDQAARRDRALVLLRQGDAVGAEADLTFLIDLGERCQDLDKIFSARALSRLMQGPQKAESALSDAEAAWKIAPTPAYDRLRQRAMLAAGRIGELQIDRPGVIAMFPLQGDLLDRDLRLAVDRLRLKMLKGTLPSYPGSLNQAVILAALNDRERAISTATTALQASPDSPHALLIRARVRLFDGDLEGAMSDVDRGLMMCPNEPGLLEVRAEGLIRKARNSEALSVLRLINSEGLQRASLDCLRARANMGMGRLPTAIQCWTDAIKRDSQLAEAYLERGRCRIALGQMTEAVFDLTNAFMLANSDVGVESRVFLAFTKCLAQRPRLARRWLSMGWKVVSHATERWKARNAAPSSAMPGRGDAS